MNKHWILIGFKHAGKSSLGDQLSKQTGLPFLDLDDAIVCKHAEECESENSCRGIIQHHGEEFFRELEHRVLKQVLETKSPSILALGGGTPLQTANQELIAPHRIIHVTAPKSVIFERIMINGKPSFFPQEESSFDHFQSLWGQRMPVFESLAEITVNNTESIETLASQVIDQLEQKTPHQLPAQIHQQEPL